MQMHPNQSDLVAELSNLKWEPRFKVYDVAAVGRTREQNKIRWWNANKIQIIPQVWVASLDNFESEPYSSHRHWCISIFDDYPLYLPRMPLISLT